jgi:Tfp pilus assembly protein PilF
LIKKLAAEFEEKKVVIEEVIQSEEPESADLKIPIVHMDPEQIQSHLTEAEVYLKYGLINKAIEQLEAVLAGDPENIPAHMHLKEIYKSEQETSKAIKECWSSEIYKQRGQQSEAGYL